LIAAVRDTALSCAVNVFHINTVSDAIIQAHDAIAPLHAEFVKNEGTLATYNADIEAFSAGASLIPGGTTVAKGVAKLFTSPPVDDDRQDQLTLQAQQAMVPLAEAAHDGAAYIKPPDPYIPPFVGDSPVTESPNEFGAPNSSGALPPPAIDSPSYTRTPGSGAASGQTAEATPRPISNSGPVLSSLTPAPVQSASISVPPIGSPINSPPSFVAIGDDLGAGLGTPVGAYGGRLPNVFDPKDAARGRSPFSNVAAPRSGVIGNVPITTGPGRSVPSRVNPSGGVIGQQPRVGSKSTPRVARSQAASGYNTATTSAQAERLGQSNDNAKHWDPDNPWEVDVGVEPVIMPDTASVRVNPGPGIIGIDR